MPNASAGSWHGGGGLPWNDNDTRAQKYGGGSNGGNTSPCGDGGPCLLGGGTGIPGAPDAPYTTYGSCGCLDGDTPVELFEGGVKKASEIANGDVLVALVGAERKPQVVTNRMTAVEPCVRISHSGGDLVCSASHSLMSDEDLPVTALGICRDEQMLVSALGEPLEIKSIAHAGVRTVFGWSTVPDSLFIAG